MGKMKKTKKTIISLMAVLAMLVVMLPAQTFAYDGPNEAEFSYASLIINDGTSNAGIGLYASAAAVEYDGVQLGTVKGAVYDKKTNTLTLTNYKNANTIIYVNEMGDDFKIRVVGTNEILSINVWGSLYKGSLEITGTGSLTLNKSKEEPAAILLYGIDDSHVRVEAGVTFKAYSSSEATTIAVDGTSFKNGNIDFDGNATLNKKVRIFEDIVYDVDFLYSAEETIALIPAKAKNTKDKNQYGINTVYDWYNDTYVDHVYKIVKDSKLGDIAVPLKEDGDWLPSDRYTKSENADEIVAIVCGTYRHDYTKVVDKNGNMYYLRYVDQYDDDTEKSNSYYELCTIENVTGVEHPIAVTYKGNLESEPKGYTKVKLYSTFNAYYDDNISIKGNGCELTLKSDGATYTGKAIKPEVIVKNSKGTTLKASSYTVTYTDLSTGKAVTAPKNIGYYKVSVKLKGSYSGTLTKTFAIQPKGTTLKKVAAKSTGLTATWNKQATGTSGYEIEVSQNKNFKFELDPVFVKRDIAKTATVSADFLKLVAKKTYYVRIRTYKTVKVNGESTKVYSNWSKVLTVKTK